jgi:hypothetical protein
MGKIKFRVRRVEGIRDKDSGGKIERPPTPLEP